MNADASVNQSSPPGPLTIPPGVESAEGRGNLTVAWVVGSNSSTEPLAGSVSQRLPSGPLVIPGWMPFADDLPTADLTSAPVAGLTWPTERTPVSVLFERYQRSPPGPLMIELRLGVGVFVG